MLDIEDIMGCNVDKCKHIVSEGCASFMKRAVSKADAIYRKACCILVACDVLFDARWYVAFRQLLVALQLWQLPAPRPTLLLT